jgi:hypothetical protein
MVAFRTGTCGGRSRRIKSNFQEESSMAPVRYSAKILPDGHLPLPEGFLGRVGDEVRVTLDAGQPELEPAEAERRAAYLLDSWAGRARGTGSGVAERHDEILYGR